MVVGFQRHPHETCRSLYFWSYLSGDQSVLGRSLQRFRGAYPLAVIKILLRPHRAVKRKMIKILCWICDRCETEFEGYYDSVEFQKLMEDDTPQLCFCGGNLVPFNLKNNCHRWRFADE